MHQRHPLSGTTAPVRWVIPHSGPQFWVAKDCRAGLAFLGAFSLLPFSFSFFVSSFRMFSTGMILVRTKHAVADQLGFDAPSQLKSMPEL